MVGPAAVKAGRETGPDLSAGDLPRQHSTQIPRRRSSSNSMWMCKNGVHSNVCSLPFATRAARLHGVLNQVHVVLNR